MEKHIDIGFSYERLARKNFKRFQLSGLKHTTEDLDRFIDELKALKPAASYRKSVLKKAS